MNSKPFRPNLVIGIVVVGAIAISGLIIGVGGELLTGLVAAFVGILNNLVKEGDDPHHEQVQQVGQNGGQNGDSGNSNRDIVQPAVNGSNSGRIEPKLGSCSRQRREQDTQRSDPAPQQDMRPSGNPNGAVAGGPQPIPVTASPDVDEDEDPFEEALEHTLKAEGMFLSWDTNGALVCCGINKEANPDWAGWDLVEDLYARMPEKGEKFPVENEPLLEQIAIKYHNDYWNSPICKVFEEYPIFRSQIFDIRVRSGRGGATYLSLIHI